MRVLDIGLAAWAMVATAIAVGKHLALQRTRCEAEGMLRTVANLAEHVEPAEAIVAGYRPIAISSK